MGDVDALSRERRAHLVSSGIITAASPERRRAAESRGSDGRIRPHAASDGRVFKAPDLLAAAGQHALDAPDLIERGQPEADQTDAARAGREIRRRADLAQWPVRAHCNTWPLSASNRCSLPGCGRSDRRSPTFGRSAGSTRAIADAPARSKCTRVSEPSGSTSFTATPTPSAPLEATAKCSGLIPRTAFPVRLSNARLLSSS